MSRIPRALAGRIDRLSRAAHRFHAFAHHPLCDRYEGEVVRLGRRGRICRGCALVALGLVGGTAAGIVLAPPVTVAGAILATSVLGSATVLGTRKPWARKLATRFLPAAGLGLAFGAGCAAAALGTRALAGVAIALGCLAALVLLRAVYGHRTPDRSPCASCPERDLPVCRGFEEVMRRERAFQRLSRRLLVRAGL